LLLLSIFKTIVLLYIFVETVIHFFFSNFFSSKEPFIWNKSPLFIYSAFCNTDCIKAASQW